MLATTLLMMDFYNVSHETMKKTPKHKNQYGGGNMFSFLSPKNFLKFSQETKIPKINFM